MKQYMQFYGPRHKEAFCIHVPRVELWPPTHMLTPPELSLQQPPQVAFLHSDKLHGDMSKDFRGSFAWHMMM